MSKCIRHERCPRCAMAGRDRSGNNLGIYADGGSWCFNCGYSTRPTYKSQRLEKERESGEEKVSKTVFPSDASREIPAAAWRWLLQYGLPYSYWQAYCSYSEKEGRLLFNVGNPTRFIIGRSFAVGTSKWKVYGDKSSYVETLGDSLSKEIVLVEDLISAHKLGQVTQAIPLFGTTISDQQLKVLIKLGKPIVLWLDNDQRPHLPKKLGRIAALTGLPVRNISTRLDPKAYSLTEIKEILNE